MNEKPLGKKQMFCLQQKEQFRMGKLIFNSKGQYIVNDHILSEGEIISVLIDRQFVETSIHFVYQNIYSSIGLPLELGEVIKYEDDL